MEARTFSSLCFSVAFRFGLPIWTFTGCASWISLRARNCACIHHNPDLLCTFECTIQRKYHKCCDIYAQAISESLLQCGKASKNQTPNPTGDNFIREFKFSKFVEYFEYFRAFVKYLQKLGIHRHSLRSSPSSKYSRKDWSEIIGIFANKFANLQSNRKEFEFQPKSNKYSFVRRSIASAQSWKCIKRVVIVYFSKSIATRFNCEQLPIPNDSFAILHSYNENLCMIFWPSLGTIQNSCVFLNAWSYRATNKRNKYLSVLFTFYSFQRCSCSST